MKKQTFITVAIASALALAGCTSHAPSNPVEQALGVAPRATQDPVAGYHQYQVTSQLAEGLMLAGRASMDIDDFYGIRGKLPMSIAQMESVLHDTPAYGSPGKYVGSVVIGPTPGKITVLWSNGALAGKTLDLLPKLGNRLCFRVDTASTTVPADALAHANVVDACHDNE